MRRVRRIGVGALVLMANGACGLLAGLQDHVLESSSSGDATTDGGASVGDAGDAGADDGALVFGSLVTLAKGQADPRGISLDATKVYWANQSGGAVLAVAKDGADGAPTVITAEAKHPRATKAGPARVFWGSDEADTGQACTTGFALTPLPVGIMAIDETPDAAAQQLYCGDRTLHVEALVIDGADIYWTNARAFGGLVARTAQTSGATSALDDQKAEAVAVNTASVFWSRADGIAMAAKSEFPPLDAGSFVPSTSPALGLVADDDAVYFTTPSAVMKVTLATPSGAPITMASMQAGPSALALFGGNVYWTNAGSGTIVTMSTDGSAASLRTLASSQGGPSSIAADETGVYWTNASGEVMCLHR